MIETAVAAMQQALPEDGDFGTYVRAVLHSRAMVQLWVLLGSGMLGMAGNYLFKYLRDDIRGSLWNYLFRDHPKSTALAALVLAGWAVTAVTSGLVQTAGWTVVINLGLTTGFAIDALVNKANQAVWTDEERAEHAAKQEPAPAPLPRQQGFVQLQLALYLLGALAFLAYSAVLYREGGRAPRAELEQFRAEVAAAQKVHEAEDQAKAAQSKTIIEEKDHEREEALEGSARRWADNLSRLREQRDRLARAAAKPARVVARICDGADGNARLSDAVGKAERDTRGAIAEYQAGVGELLVIAERQAAEWDNLKRALTGIRAVNATTGAPAR